MTARRRMRVAAGARRVHALVAGALVASAAVVALGGCTKRDDGSAPPASAPPTAAPSPSPSSSSQPLPPAPPSPADRADAPGAPGHDAHWLRDDYALARARASETGKLLFVDAWAEWCHTCWSMKRDVLSDARVTAFADRYVLVELDTDRPENAAFLTAHPVKLWPTFFVVDPTTDATVAVRPGAMSLDDTVRFLDDALRSARGGDASDEKLARAYAALFGGQPDVAYPLFAEVGESASARRTEAVLGAIRAAREARRVAPAIALAERELEKLGHHALVYDVASAMHFAAASSGDDALASTTRAAAERALAPLVDDPPPGLSVDDRADLMSTLAELARARGDEARATTLLTAILALTEADAARAGTPEGARVHDYLRMNAYLALSRGDEAVAMLRARTRELPSSYEAWARLASALTTLGRHDEARPAMERAVALSYGPRRLRYLVSLADILAKLGDEAGARAALTRAIDENAALPFAMRLDAVANDAEKKRAALGGG